MIVLLNFLWCLIHIKIVVSSCVGDQGECSDFQKETNKYSFNANRWNRYITTYENAQSAYSPCMKKACSCFSKTIDQDLSHWSASGISENETLKSFSNFRGVLYQVIDHKLYRSKECLFPSRCEGVEYFLRQILPQLSDLEFVLNDRDNPQVHTVNEPLPIFSFSKIRGEHLDIMYPAWSFWTGGPALWPLYPTGIGRWEEHRLSLTAEAQRVGWESRDSRGFFRGSRTNSDRDPLILLSRREPRLIDAQYTKNQAWRSEADTLNKPPAGEVKLEDHCQYKYLFNFAGVAASFRLRHLFLCKSVVIHVGNKWLEFFYEAMTPWVHYVPLDVNSVSSAGEIIEFLRDNDEIAHQIAENGFKFIWDHLRQEDVVCYWRRLLRRYGRLLRYKVKLKSDMLSL